LRVSTKGRYALRAMVELAIEYAQGPLQLKEIARRQEISEKYLEQIMTFLRTDGYVLTQKGSHGGYYLSLPPEEVTLLEVLRTTEGSLAPVSCVENPDTCGRIDLCVVRKIWTRVKEVICEELESVTLADLAIEQKNLRQQQNEPPYFNI